MNCCIICKTECKVLVKPYKSRGRFPNKTGAICQNCLRKMQSYLMPKTKDELIALVDKMREEGAI